MFRTLLIFAGLVLTASAVVAQGALGSIAVFKDDIPPSGAPASPDYLAGVLRRAGFDVAALNAEQLANPRELSRDRFDLVLLPYGGSFPVKAASNFRRFLQQGGKFFSTGGYAFDNLLERSANGWRTPAVPPPPAIDHVIWRYEWPAEDLRGRGSITFSGWLKAAEVSGPGMAFFAVYQTATNGTLPDWRDLCRVTGSKDWQEFRYTFDVHPQSATVDIRAGLYRCRGTAWFDDLRLTDAAGRVLLESDFEKDFDANQQGPRRWTRSDSQRCSVQTETHRSGQRALKTTLDFVLPREERLNTRHGRPEDGLEVEPTQLGVFQADYLLERVAYAQAAPNQCLVDKEVRFNGSLQGHAACGVVGFDHARWLPLLNTYDRYGRLRGAAGALLRHYAGPYAGSSWAFFGVTNRDFFAESEPAMADALVSVVRSLVNDTYLASLVTDQACYRKGEEVEILATLFNGGRQKRALQLHVEAYEGEPPDSQKGPPLKRLAVLEPATAVVEPARTNLVRLRWKPPRLRSDFCYLVSRLFADGQECDLLESGFVIWDEKTLAAGPKLNYRDNYLRFGKRPLFLLGTDDWGYVFNTTRETPLQWLRDMRQRRDLGVMIYENLQFGLLKPQQQEQLLRKTDGVVQLAQKYHQVYFPCLLCGYNVAASDTELAQHKEFCRAYAQRYATVPGLIYYLNGDLRCRLSDAVTPQWNQFLRERHGTTENLCRAWGPRAPALELGALPAEDFQDWGHQWDNLKVYDQNLFRAWLIRRWHTALIEGIREHDVTHPTTSEFYQLPHEGVDIPAGVDGLDLSNFGYFDRPSADLKRFPAICKFNDQRARGKSFGPGEYGVKTHPAWGDGKDYGYHIARTREQALELFLGIAHYSLGLGASRIHNWCWKDDAHRVFPWGMVYPCDNVPKDIACLHRNQSLLFRHFAPVYREPSVYVLLADSHRFGGAKWQVIEGILTAFDLALATHVENLGTLNEMSLNIPRSAKVIFYPLPFCPPDDVYTKVLDWVRQGGVLYVSGDISYDELRRRTRVHRLEELCGVRFLKENYPNIALDPTNAAPQPCLQVEPLVARVRSRAPDGSALVVENRVGRGQVILNLDPIELHSVPARRTNDLVLYRDVLHLAGVKPIGLEPDDPRLHLFRLPLQNGGQVRILFNTDETQPARKWTLTDCRPEVSVSVARRRPALLWFDGRNALRAVETHGACERDGRLVVNDETESALLSLDGKDVARSKALLLMPLKPGTVTLPSAARWREPVIETGEVQNGHWRTYETTPLRPLDAGLRVNVTPDQVFSWLILCEKAAAPRWREALERAMCNPAFME